MFLRQSIVVLSVVLGVTGCLQRPPIPPNKYEPAERYEEKKVSKSMLCNRETGDQYRLKKRVTLLSFNVKNPNQATDLPSIETSFPYELEKRLKGSKKYLVNNATDQTISKKSLDMMGQYTENRGDQVIMIAKKENSQYIVIGSFYDLSASYYNNVIDSVRKWPERQLNAELEIYDGFSGALIDRHEYQERVKGRVDMKGYMPFESKFNLTEYGQAFQNLVSMQIEDIDDDLACRPVSGRITSLSSNMIYIDIGSSSNLLPGDKLTVLRQQVHTHDFELKPVIQELSLGVATVKRVYDESAQATVEVSRGRIEDLKPGDIVRSR